jgi:FkbM family methyltransferase
MLNLFKKSLIKIKQKGIVAYTTLAIRHIFKKFKEKILIIYLMYFVCPKVSSDAINKIKDHGGRGLYLDCGSNIGQGFNTFRKFFTKDYFDYELFEPNQNCIPHLEQVKRRLNGYEINIHNSAISTSNGTTLFYGLSEIEGGSLSQGGSTLKEHNSSIYTTNKETATLVNTINFIEHLTTRSKKYSIIVIKMDIEGGEYELLESMIHKNSFKNIHSIFCEFHSEYMKSASIEKYKNLEIKFEKEIKDSGCIFIRWI